MVSVPSPGTVETNLLKQVAGSSWPHDTEAEGISLLSTIWYLNSLPACRSNTAVAGIVGGLRDGTRISPLIPSCPTILSLEGTITAYFGTELSSVQSCADVGSSEHKVEARIAANIPALHHPRGTDSKDEGDTALSRADFQDTFQCLLIIVNGIQRVQLRRLSDCENVIREVIIWNAGGA